jgi:PEP-CTERM motif
MRTVFLLSILAGLMAPFASAGTISYNTTGSTLSCNGVTGCVQDTSTSVTDGGITFTYNAGSGSGVATPSIINFGNIVSTGTGTNVNVAGLLLTINVNSTPPGGSGTLPNGSIAGTISTNSSGATLTFSPDNTTTPFGTLPGVVIGGGGQAFAYQILNPSLGLQAPTVGNPVGQTSIQGAVTDVSAPEPATLIPMAAGLGLVGLSLRRRNRKAPVCPREEN